MPHHGVGDRTPSLVDGTNQQIHSDRGTSDVKASSNAPALSKVSSYGSLDLTIQTDGGIKLLRSDHDIALDKINLPEALREWLWSKVKDVQASGVEGYIRLLFSHSEGYLVRSDFLDRRLQGCEHIAEIRSFVKPLQHIHPVETNEIHLFPLEQAFGGLLIETNEEHTIDQILQDLDQELENRLSFPWLLSSPISQRRVAWVQGRENIQSIRRAYDSALALGITLVIFDSPGHWLEDNDTPWAKYREAFVPVNIEPDEGFTDRIVEAVSRYPHKFDGLLAISDVRLPGIARACEILGLPTSPSEAYAIAGDKAKTRLAEGDSNDFAVLSHADELPAFLEKRQDIELPYPMIVKPCIGWNSDCVAKVTNDDDLRKAVQKASERHENASKQSTAVLIEPYAEGPEVDANFVLLDGEVLFYDINDDFPSQGDSSDAGFESNFQETQNVMPTALPEREVELLRDSLTRSILSQGFTSGIFHCEARVRNSTVHYISHDGLLDLVEKTTPPVEAANVYLHEINARPPGYLETVAVDLTYGVDYYALRLLLSIGAQENERTRALSQPFLQKSQYHLSAMICPQTRAGIMKTSDAGADFLAKYPILAKQIPDYKTQMLAGDALDGPAASSLWWVAYFSVFSRKSRKDCLQLVRFIEENFEYELES